MAESKSNRTSSAGKGAEKATPDEETENKQVSESEKPQEGADQNPAPDEGTSTTDKAAGASRGRAAGGTFVVIADQLVTLAGEGKEMKATVHKRGAEITLTEAQAKKWAQGTRPAVVAASEVKDGNVRAAQVGAIRRAMARRHRSKSKR